MKSMFTHKTWVVEVLAFIISFWGCASDPVPTYLPANHPAHPDAAEAVYTATPNPFQNGMSMNKMLSDETPNTPPDDHKDSHHDQMKSKDKHQEKTIHHHKENN